MINMDTLRKRLLLALPLLLAAGCSGGNPTSTAPKAETAVPEKLEPVTITIFRQPGFAGKFEDTLIAQVKQKFPHITISFVEAPLKEQIAAGTTPDMAVITQTSILDYVDLGLAFDMEPIIKKFNFDMSQLQTAWVDMLRADINGKRQLLAIPYHTGISGLYYNKDIFDRFSVPYPKDDMTWEETIELAKKITRTEGGVKYYGIASAGLLTNYLHTQLSLNMVDPKTDKTLINTDFWQQLIRITKGLYDVSGMEPAQFRSGTPIFGKDKNLAMFVATNEIRNMLEVNWDVVTLPGYKDKPKQSRGPTGLGFAITSTSQHKDDAFRVITIMMSEEVQKAVAQDGRPSILKKESMRDEFIKSSPALNGKNAMAFFKNQPAPIHQVSRYETIVNRELTKSYDEIMAGKKDINTGLREAEERINKGIEDDKKAK
jgi:multiple sugar transport system substrate-binding protein